MTPTHPSMNTPPHEKSPKVETRMMVMPDSMIDLLAMMKEPLREELQPYMWKDGPLGPCIKHKWVNEMTHIPGVANQLFEAKQEIADEAVKQGNWFLFVFTHERPWRVDALRELIIENHLQMDDPEFQRITRQVWTDSENIYQELPFWSVIFSCHSGHYWMDDDEREQLRVMRATKEHLLLFRGECNDGGYSWTLSRKTAEFFADRGMNESTGSVIQASIDSADVFAYLDTGESEILVTKTDKLYDVTEIDRS